MMALIQNALIMIYDKLKLEVTFKYLISEIQQFLSIFLKIEIICTSKAKKR